ncbi:MAG: thioredoxin family protein, partial [Enterobacteriaceae bacterium]
ESFWQQHVLQADKHTLALFWSPLQAESIKLITQLESQINDYPRWQLVPVDTYKNHRLAHRYQVTRLPTLIRLQQGEETGRLVEPDSAQLLQLFKESSHD